MSGIKMNSGEIKEFLERKVIEYNRFSFIEQDPIQVPHKFNLKADIEISGFLSATIAWGNRKSIIRSAERMMALFDQSPYDFVINHSDKDLERLEPFVHRTFNGIDLQQFIRSLKHIYLNHGGLESIFNRYAEPRSLQSSIHNFKQHFFEIPHTSRSQKHISDPLKNSAAKRINMFLRWMVRQDKAGVDFGIWNSIRPSQLSCPLDVHSGKVARSLGILNRKANDAKAVKELDDSLRTFDPDDPVKYDFALFGLGVFENF